MDEAAQVALLEGLLTHYSPTGQEGAAVDYLVAQMRALGGDARADAIGNAVGTWGAGEREILLLGHIDTVPGAIPVRRAGDTLWGRGAVDAKGPLACFTAAAALAGQAGLAPGWRITVIGALAEEGDSRGALFVKDRRPPYACIIGAPSGWDKITLAYKGSAWFEYTLRLPLAHTAAAAESACDAAVSFWNRFQAARAAFNAGRERAFEQLGASLRKMESSQDGFYDAAQLHFNLRLPPDLSPAQADALIRPLAGEAALRLVDGIECYRADKNTPLVRALLSAIRTRGGQPGFLLKTGTSDMNIVGPAWRCPILAYGPGDSKLDHTPDEHISIAEYLKSVQVLFAALQNLIAAS